LIKDNLVKRGWQRDIHYIFYNNSETIDHLFIHCSIAICLWSWVASYNNFQFSCQNIENLWCINAVIPYKDDNICEMLRGAILWVIWKEMNNLIFNYSRRKL
jgi:zinc-binding in reverse transcriptase